MSWLPRIKTFGQTNCDFDFESEGRALQVVWGKWVFEFHWGRIVADYPDAR